MSAWNSHLSFEVADDGRGFDLAATANGTGLQGMADRLQALGGSIEIRSRPGQGTTITGSIPVAGSTD
jgi:two-component system, NarL family, sensor histidine kinase UhpB